MEKFYLVWCLDGGPPNIQHNNFDEAKAEAKRLSIKNPDLTFVVMVSVGFCKAKPAKAKYTEID